MDKDREPKRDAVSGGGTSIIIPVFVRESRELDGFTECYGKLLTQWDGETTLQVLVVDSSGPPEYESLDRQLKEVHARMDTDRPHVSIYHFPPDKKREPGESDKLNNVRCALRQAHMPYVALLDHDARPTREVIRAMAESLRQAWVVKCMAAFEGSNIFDFIDLVGIYVINVVSPDRQFYAHVCFHQELLDPDNFFSLDILFDDLAVYRHCCWQARLRRLEPKPNHPPLVFKYIAAPPLSVSCSERRLLPFLKQRLRWGYENAACPVRFVFFLCIIPIIAWLAYCQHWTSVMAFVGGLTLWVVLLALIGQCRFRPANAPRWQWLLAPLWFWLYPVMSWLSIWYAVVGCPFAGARLRRPCIFPRWRDSFSW